MLIKHGTTTYKWLTLSDCHRIRFDDYKIRSNNSTVLTFFNRLTFPARLSVIRWFSFSSMSSEDTGN